MATLKKFVPGQAVRVVALKRVTRKISGSQGVLRQPVVGDEAEVLNVIAPAGESAPEMLTLQCINDDGKVVWHADFELDELEAVEAPQEPKA